MEKLQLKIPGAFLIKNFRATDRRGEFVKSFNVDAFSQLGMSETFVETYYSVSHLHVIRGMHFQLPPFDHSKLVYVCSGQILDVILDIRTGSPTFGMAIDVTLRACGDSVYIPKGCAHGFQSLEPDTIVMYHVSSVYNQDADRGILWNSFGFDWPRAEAILSDRDMRFPAFKDFSSPF